MPRIPAIRLLSLPIIVFLLITQTLAAVEIVPAPGAASPMAIPVETADDAAGAGEREDADGWRDRVVAITVRGAIIGKPFSDMADQITAALDRADREGARLIILEIDSPGGEVGTCDKLSKRISDAKVPVVSLVLHKAVSGAAMLASAAPEIVMTRSARLGDIQPMQVAIAGEAPKMDERTAEKIEVDIRTIMKVYAQMHNRPVAVMEGMVSRGFSLYQVTFEDGSVEYLTGHEMELLEQNIEKGRDKRTIADSKILKPEGKLLELSAQQAVDYGIASTVVDNADAFYAQREIDRNDVVRPDIEEGELSILKLIPSFEDLGLPIWVVVLLGVFLVVGVAGLVTEYNAPGSGIPAAIGIIGFVCFFTTLLMHDRGNPLGVFIFLVGIGLLVVEIMVLPGFGVAGILGILAILGGLFLSFTPEWDTEYMNQFMWHEVGAFTLLMLMGLLAAFFVIWLISEYGQKLPFLGRFFLTDAQEAGSNPNPEAVVEESRESLRTRLRSLVGQGGVAESMLRPAGKVRLDTGELLDVITDGVYVEAGRRVTVVSAAPNRYVVAAEKPAES